MKEKPITGAAALAIRTRRGINQTAFWNHVGVTQSGGCRYEAGRNIPRPVQTLLRIAYMPDGSRIATDLISRAPTGRAKTRQPVKEKRMATKKPAAPAKKPAPKKPAKKC